MNLPTALYLGILLTMVYAALLVLVRAWQGRRG